MTEPGTPATRLIRIYDRAMPRPVEFAGERIGFGTSERPDSVRWAEIEVYRLDDGGYMVHRFGYSLVYHRSDTWCRTSAGAQPGDPASVDDLPDEAVPCRDCQPKEPQLLGDDEQVRYETQRHTFDSCPSAEKAIEALTVIRKRDGSAPSVRFSGPVRDALRQAADADPEFYRILPGSILQ